MKLSEHSPTVAAPLPSMPDAIKRLRERTKLSQEGLGREVDLSWKTIARYEGGSTVSGDSMIKFIRFCESRSLDDLAQFFRVAYINELGTQSLQSVATAIHHRFDPTCHLCRHFALQAAAPELLRATEELLAAIADDSPDLPQRIRETQTAVKAAKGIWI